MDPHPQNKSISAYNTVWPLFNCRTYEIENVQNYLEIKVANSLTNTFEIFASEYIYPVIKVAVKTSMMFL
jgi:hypothetical protein